ncbi:hypothetical protein ACFL6S_23835 [Candidatus Poribacteria bacterium]
MASDNLTRISRKTLDLLEKEHIAAIPFDEIEGMYEVPEEHREKIQTFLEEHRHLLPILGEAEGKITSVFGKNVKLRLELHSDPEEVWDELFIVIRSGYSATEALRLENKLAQEWFLDKMKDTKGRLNIIEEPL